VLDFRLAHCKFYVQDHACFLFGGLNNGIVPGTNLYGKSIDTVQYKISMAYGSDKNSRRNTTQFATFGARWAERALLHVGVQRTSQVCAGVCACFGKHPLQLVMSTMQFSWGKKLEAAGKLLKILSTCSEPRGEVGGAHDMRLQELMKIHRRAIF
jgi:hypothetical protein